MTYKEAQAKAQDKLVKGDDGLNLAQSAFAKEIIGATFETRSGKLFEVVEAINNNFVIKSGDVYDAAAIVWVISHIERGSFERK